MLMGESVDGWDERCRTCLGSGGRLGAVWDLVRVGEAQMSVAEVVSKSGSVQISHDDGLPQRICEICKESAIKSQLFRIQCETTDRYLKSLIPNEANSKKVPPSLFEDMVEDLETVGPEETIEFVIEDENTCPSDDHHNDDPEDTTTEATKSEEHPHPNLKNRTCPLCHKTFQHRSSMLKHQRKHTAPPKPCPHCPFQPLTPSHLSKHLQQQHADLKTVKCPLCPKTFFKEASLRLHVRTHSGVKRHTCEVCGLSFALGGNLSAHRRLHTGERPYACAHCGRGFAQHSALRSHEAGHSDRRDHVCGQCGAAFSRAGALRNHRKRHAGAKDYECGICGRRFTFSSERKRHVRIHSGEKRFECGVCGRRFSRNANLKVHGRIHTGETPHVCAVCGKGFVQAHCLRTHAKTHEKGG